MSYVMSKSLRTSRKWLFEGLFVKSNIEMIPLQFVLSFLSIYKLLFLEIDYTMESKN